MLLLMLMENDEWDNGNIKFIAKVKSTYHSHSIQIIHFTINTAIKHIFT